MVFNGNYCRPQALSTCANAQIWAETFCSRDGLVYSFWLGIAASVVLQCFSMSIPQADSFDLSPFEKGAGRTNHAPFGEVRQVSVNSCHG